MNKFNYEEQAQALSEVIDVAIDAFKKYPPKGFTENHIQQFLNTYLDFKNKATKPEPKYRNSASLKILANDVLIFFQEGAGETVHYFWKIVNEKKLGYKRENKLAKILKRQKIKNQDEYNFIIDVIVPYQQESLITQSDVDELNQMISDFEKR